MLLNKTWLSNRSYTIILFFSIFLILTFYKVLHKKFNINNKIQESEINNFDNDYKIVYLGDQRQTSHTTIVTSLFLFRKSKHSRNDYDKWSNTMIKSMGAPFVAFIDFNWEKRFLDRSKKNNLTGNNTLKYTR